MSYSHSSERWRQATKALTIVQYGIYHRLIEWAEVNGHYLPADEATLVRIVGAKNQTERNAVAFVVGMFFMACPEGLQQSVEHHRASAIDAGDVQAAHDLDQMRKKRSRAKGRAMVDALHGRGIAAHQNLGNTRLEALCRAHGVRAKGWSWSDEAVVELDSETPRNDGVVLKNEAGYTPEMGEGLYGYVTQRDGEIGGYVTGRDGMKTGCNGMELVTQRDASSRARAESIGIGIGIPVLLKDQVPNTKNNTALAALGPRAAAGAGVRPTPAGEAGLALKAGGITDLNLSHPRLLRLLDAGVTPLELTAAASEATTKGKGFAYALAMVEGRRRDAEAAGPVPGPVKSRRDAEADRFAEWTGGLSRTLKP